MVVVVIEDVFIVHKMAPLVTVNACCSLGGATECVASLIANRTCKNPVPNFPSCNRPHAGPPMMVKTSMLLFAFQWSKSTQRVLISTGKHSHSHSAVGWGRTKGQEFQLGRFMAACTTITTEGEQGPADHFLLYCLPGWWPKVSRQSH